MTYSEYGIAAILITMLCHLAVVLTLRITKHIKRVKKIKSLTKEEAAIIDTYTLTPDGNCGITWADGRTEIVELD